MQIMHIMHIIYTPIYAPNMGMWGIPEKCTKNAAQNGRPDVRRTLHSKVVTKNQFREVHRVNPLEHKWVAL